MAKGEEATILEGVRRIFGGGTVATLGETSMLRRFVARGEESAFEAIVATHGPMVLGVCRRILNDRHDVEDAFQAVFLILVRKAGSIRDEEGLGPWLHGVSRRVAIRARVRGTRRRATERTGLEVEATCPADDPDLGEIRAVVDEEIGRLPDRYRRLVVLCDLEGVTQGEAARRLAWTEGTVRGRLAKGRALLRSRLTRRGLAAPAALMPSLLSTDRASIARLCESATKVATGGSESVSASVVALAREVMNAMIRHKLTSMALGTLVVGIVVSGAGWIAGRVTRADDRPTVKSKPRSTALTPGSKEFIASFPGIADPIDQKELAKPPEPEPADARRIAIGDRLRIEALKALPGRPLTGERIVRPDGTTSLGFYGDVKLAGLTRREAKVKVIEQLRQVLTDEALGLAAFDGTVNQMVAIHPVRSHRVFVDDSPTFEHRGTPLVLRPAGAKAEATPAKIRPGDRLIIEVVQALPSRPISGEHIVRPDGTVSLGFYGDLKVVGLTRGQAKVEVINYLRQYLDDKSLGLVAPDKEGNVFVPVAPERSTSVLVDEAEPFPTSSAESRLDAIEHKLDLLYKELQDLKARGR